MQSALDGWVDSEVKGELLSGVLGVGLQGSQDLSLLGGIQHISGDDGDLFFFVEQLVQLLVPGGNMIDVDQSLVLGQHLQELDGQLVEVSEASQSLVKGLDFSSSYTLVLSEESERL